MRWDRRWLRIALAGLTASLAVGTALLQEGERWWDDRMNPALDAGGVALLAGPVIVVVALLNGWFRWRSGVGVALWTTAAAWTGWMAGFVVGAFEIREADTAPRGAWLLNGGLAVAALGLGWALEAAVVRWRDRPRETS